MEDFNVGDFIKTEDGKIGVVGWVENKCMDLKKEDGCVGIDLLTHGRGFLAPVKSEKCKRSSVNEVIDFYKAEETRLIGIIHQQKIDRNILQQLETENKHLRQLLSLYIQK